MYRRLAWIAVVSLTAAALAPSASAQAPSPGAAGRTPTASPPTAAQTAAAVELFKAIKLEESIPSTSAAMIDSEVRGNPGMVPYRDVMLKWLQKYMTWESMRPEMVRLYTDTYTEAELKQLAAFYKTPLGQKTLAKTPELLQRTAMIGARLGQEHSEELKTAMNARSDELHKEQEKAQAAAKTPAKATAPSPPAAKRGTPAPKKP
jgi:uncharacterized protein